MKQSAVCHERQWLVAGRFSRRIEDVFYSDDKSARTGAVGASVRDFGAEYIEYFQGRISWGLGVSDP